MDLIVVFPMVQPVDDAVQLENRGLLLFSSKKVFLLADCVPLQRAVLAESHSAVNAL